MHISLFQSALNLNRLTIRHLAYQGKIIGTMMKGNTIKTVNGGHRPWDHTFMAKLANFPNHESGVHKHVYMVFRSIVKIIQAGRPVIYSLDFSFPDISNSDLHISRIGDHYNTICVTHKPSGFGWGYDYTLDIDGICVEIEDGQTVKIVPAKYVWVVINGDYMTCDPKCVHSFSTKKAAEEWNKKQKGAKGTIFQFRHE
jgi:hypothetical protein